MINLVNQSPYIPHDVEAFDIYPRSGFIPPKTPISRLPEPWSLWEDVLDAAQQSKLQVGDKMDLTESEAATSSHWRNTVREMSVLSTAELTQSPILIRRAHLALTYILHFYVQSIPPNDAISIPQSISIPLLHVSQELDVPPVVTYSDIVLYNWDFITAPEAAGDPPTLTNIRSQTMFTGLVHEEEFYLVSSRIELRGAEVLDLMRLTVDEIFSGDASAVKRVTEYLRTISGVVDALKDILLDVKKRCDPDIYYNQVRPWLRGEDAASKTRKWVFEGIEQCPNLHAPQEMSGPSAGQSCLIHSLDVFFGVDHSATSPGRQTFMSRLQTYMPKNHRRFLEHLKNNPRPLRDFVMASNDEGVLLAFNRAVAALKAFRDAHMIIVTLYILGPARRAEKLRLESNGDDQDISKEPVKGTGGTDLVKFLKDTRTRTTEALIPKLQ